MGAEAQRYRALDGGGAVPGGQEKEGQEGCGGEEEGVR